MPFPLIDGGRIRVFNLLKQLAQKSDVTLLALETQPADVKNITFLERIGIQVILVPNVSVPPLISLRTLFTALLKKEPITITRYNVRAYRQKFRELIATEAFDLVHYEMLHTAQFYGETDLPSLLSQQNVDSAIWRRLAQETGNPVRKFLYWTQQCAFERYERKMIPNFDVIACASEIDQAYFQRTCPQSRIEVIPNGVDVQNYQPDFASRAEMQLMYIGSMDWYPNEDAVFFFANEVLPKIHKKLPNVTFSAVGSNPSMRLQKLANNRQIIVTGRVPEIKPYFAQTTVFVVPLRIGSGTRLKILEALAMGKAVVSTSVGAEGLDLVSGEEIFIADEPEAFAEAVLRLLTTPSLRQRIGENGRVRVVKDYDWRSIGAKVYTFYESIL